MWEVIKEPYCSRSEDVEVYNDNYREKMKQEQWRIRCKLFHNFDKPIRLYDDDDICDKLCKTRKPRHLLNNELEYIKGIVIINYGGHCIYIICYVINLIF